MSNSGVYVILMAECNPDVAPMVVHGTIDSMDPCNTFFEVIIFHLFYHLRMILFLFDNFGKNKQMDICLRIYLVIYHFICRCAYAT